MICVRQTARYVGYTTSNRTKPKTNKWSRKYQAVSVRISKETSRRCRRIYS